MVPELKSPWPQERFDGKTWNILQNSYIYSVCQASFFKVVSLKLHFSSPEDFLNKKIARINLENSMFVLDFEPKV